MAKTYEPIATQTVSGGATADLTFSSISSAYTDLVLVGSGGQSSSDYLGLQFNGDTATNYSYTDLNGDGTTATSVRHSTQSRILLYWYTYPSAGSLGKTTIVNIMNYSNATTYKTLLSRNSSATGGAELIAGLWRSTAAVNAIKIYPLTGNFVSGSTWTLYGIKSA